MQRLRNYDTIFRKVYNQLFLIKLESRQFAIYYTLCAAIVI